MFELTISNISFWVALSIYIASSLWFLFIAFRESVWWGLGCLFIPLFPLVYAVLDWHNAGKAFLIALFSLCVIVFLKLDVVYDYSKIFIDQVNDIFSSERTNRDLQKPDVRLAVPMTQTTSSQSDNTTQLTSQQSNNADSTTTANINKKVVPTPIVIKINGGKKLKNDPYSEVRDLPLASMLNNPDTIRFSKAIICMKKTSPRTGVIISLTPGQIVLERRVPGGIGIVKQFIDIEKINKIILPDQEARLPSNVRSACR